MRFCRLMSNVTQPGPRRMLRPALPNLPRRHQLEGGPVVPGFDGLRSLRDRQSGWASPSAPGADVVGALRDRDGAAGARAVDAADQPAAENVAGDAVLEHRLARAERQLRDEVGDQPMADVEVARPFPRLEVAAVLRTAGCGVQMLGRLVARLAERVRRAIAVAVAEAFLEARSTPL